MDHENYLSVISSEAVEARIIDEEDIDRFQRELWDILARHADAFALGDSSLRVENAQELFKSICFVISLAMKSADRASAMRSITERGARALMDMGNKILAERIQQGRKLYESALRTALPLDNIAYRDTLLSIGGFFQHYRYDLLAHDIPCMIDYPLADPMPDLMGIEYINEYLRRIILENEFCGCFDANNLLSLMNRHCIDFKEQLVNVYEPVSIHALGLAMLGKSPQYLDISPPDRALLEVEFMPTSRKALLEMLYAAARKLIAILNLDPARHLPYLFREADDLCSRLHRLKTVGGIEGIFGA